MGSPSSWSRMNATWRLSANARCASLTARSMQARRRRRQMLLETIHLALTAIWRNALRSILTLLGVTIGVAAVIAMTTLGQGATAEVGNSIAGLGTNLLVMRPGHLTTGAGAFGIAAFGLDDVEAIDKQIASINVVAPIAVGSLTATAGT